MLVIVPDYSTQRPIMLRVTMELNAEELELAAVSTAIATGCHPCTDFHVRECRNLSVPAGRIRVAVREGAAIANAALNHLLSKHDPEVESDPDASAGTGTYRQSVLCRLGASVAANSVRLLREQVREARAIGIRDSEIMEIVALAESIKSKAASHLDPLIDRLDASRAVATAAAQRCV